jgi:serine/threonine protein kinase
MTHNHRPTDMSPDEISDRIAALTNEAPRHPPVVVRDTSNFMTIDRDAVIEVGGQLYLVRRNEREGRFGLEEEPKFWVKQAIGLADGKTYILKLVFHENFVSRIGGLRIRCTRSATKEAEVLDAVRGDSRFMQGHTVPDARGNLVRVIEFITGPSLYNQFITSELPHEQYFHEELPKVLTHILECFAAIQKLHHRGLCHGDIRNDHILIDRESGEYRWIDFDMSQDFPDYDVWSMGNILHCTVGNNVVTFRDVRAEQPELAESLTENDASVFFRHRVMNLRKVFPYVPEKLNTILMSFSIGTETFYDTAQQVIDDVADFVASQSW